jgi:hypothetical protein
MNRLTSRSKTTQSPTERRTLKTFSSRVSLILCLQLSLISVAWAQTPDTSTTVAQAKTNYLPKLDAKFLVGAPLEPLNFRVAIGGTLGRGQLCAPPARIPL